MTHQIALPEDVERQLTEQASALGQSVDGLIREAIVTFLHSNKTTETVAFRDSMQTPRKAKRLPDGRHRIARNPASARFALHQSAPYQGREKGQTSPGPHL